MALDVTQGISGKPSATSSRASWCREVGRAVIGGDSGPHIHPDHALYDPTFPPYPLIVNLISIEISSRPVEWRHWHSLPTLIKPHRSSHLFHEMQCIFVPPFLISRHVVFEIYQVYSCQNISKVSCHLRQVLCDRIYSVWFWYFTDMTIGLGEQSINDLDAQKWRMEIH